MFLKGILKAFFVIISLILPHLAIAQNAAPPKSDLPSSSPTSSSPTSKDAKPSQKTSQKISPETKSPEDKTKEKKTTPQVTKPPVQREPSEKLFFIATPTIDASKEGIVVIDSTKAPGSYRSLRIKNTGDSELDLKHVQIVYSDGSVHNEDRPINIKNGERTRKIAETDADKFIDRITLTWKATGGQTKLQVIGYQTPQGRKVQRPYPPLAHNIPLPSLIQTPQRETAKVGVKSPQSQESGAPTSEVSPTPLVILPEKHVFLSSPKVDLSNDGNVTIDTRRSEGAFRSVRVRNEGGNEVDLAQVQIVYSDGTVHNEDRLITIKKGERTRKIAETPTDKFIDRVTLFWKGTGGQTKLQIIGYQTSEGRKLERSGPSLSEKVPLPSPIQGLQKSPSIGPENEPEQLASSNISPQEETPSASLNLPERPVFFASPKVDLSVDGTITIDTERTEGAFRSVRIRNNGGNLVNLTNVQIAYNDGTIHNEDRFINIKKGERTRKIAETPTDKFIDRVTLTWKATGGQTKLQIIGYQTSVGRKMERSNPALSQNIPLPPTMEGSPIGPTLPPAFSPETESSKELVNKPENSKNEMDTVVALPPAPSTSTSSEQFAKIGNNDNSPPTSPTVDKDTGAQTTTGTTELAKGETAPSPYPETDKTINGAPNITPTSTPSNIVDISYPGDEILIGYQNISLSIERHNIKINPELGKIAHIRFSTPMSEIKVTSLKVLYSDGSFQDITLNADIKDQAPSPWVDLQGEKFIREIEYNIQTKKNSKEIARIEISGQHIKGWLVENGEGKKFNMGWAILGAKTTSFKNIDKDTFKIAENDGGLTKIKIIAKDRPLTLREIRVIYFSGPDEVFTIKDRVDPQKPYGPLEFRGGRSAVKEIQVKYRARIDLANGLNNLVEGAPAIVELWGQY